MIVFSMLRWSNCFSYGPDNEVDLSSARVSQIIGSNGAGKSSIPNILEEVLFNKNSKGIKKAGIPNRAGDGTYSINLEFSVGTDEYMIDLERTKSLKVVLLKNGDDISGHTATTTFKTIEGILGIDFKTFTQIVYQSPTGSLQFLTATDSVRKKFLVDLLNLSNYVEYFETFKMLAKDYNLKLAGLESKVATISSWLSKNDSTHTEALPIENFDKTSEVDEEALGLLRAELKNISSINQKIEKNNHYKTQLERLDMQEAHDIKATEKLDYDSLANTAGGLVSEIKQGRAFATKVQKLKDKCPTCFQPIASDFKESMLAETLSTESTLKAELEALRVEIDVVKLNNADLERKRKLERQFETLYNSVDNTIATELVNPADLRAEIADLTDRLARFQAERSATEQRNAKAERHNARISLIAEQREGFQEQLLKASADLETCQDTFDNLEILKKAFSTNGLLAYKIETLVKELESMTNMYLSELSEGKFTLEFAVERDKLNVLITNNSETVGIESLSSGELAKVNTATLLAIRKLMNSISKTQINVLFLDEIIGVLDGAGRERLVDVLLEESDLNVFIVSHEWEHPLLSKLIVQGGEMSKVFYG